MLRTKQPTIAKQTNKTDNRQPGQLQQVPKLLPIVRKSQVVTDHTLQNPSSIFASPIAYLQRTIGNQALGLTSFAIPNIQNNYRYQSLAEFGVPKEVIQRYPNSLSQYPETERKKLQVSTTPVSQNYLEGVISEVFGPIDGASTSYDIDATVLYSNEIPSKLHRGLNSIGAWLINTSHSLFFNSTLTVAIDLRLKGGTYSNYRFTYFMPGKTKSAEKVLLIEKMGAVNLNRNQNNKQQDQPSNGPFRVRNHSFKLIGHWSAAQVSALQQALDILPDRALTSIEGASFDRRGEGSKDEAGHYDPQKNTIQMHTNAFPESANRFGNSLQSVRTIAHEIGHALDLIPLEHAWKTFNSSGQLPKSRGSFLKARSLSGSRYQKAKDGDYSQIDDHAKIDNEYRRAAQRDGVKIVNNKEQSMSGAITQYGNKDWLENFAESFSLYATDPETLRLLKPNIFRYFAQRYPSQLGNNKLSNEPNRETQ